MLRAQNCVFRCAQPTSRRLLRKTAILTQSLAPAQHVVTVMPWYIIKGATRRGRKSDNPQAKVKTSTNHWSSYVDKEGNTDWDTKEKILGGLLWTLRARRGWR